jgi:hypothetical protein
VQYLVQLAAAEEAVGDDEHGSLAWREAQMAWLLPECIDLGEIKVFEKAEASKRIMQASAEAAKDRQS